MTDVDNDPERWEPAPLGEVVALLRGLASPWWVAGGYAIELAVGRAYREHGDVDVALPRRDQLAVRRLLVGWDVHVAGVAETTLPWPVGETLPRRAHDIWVRERPGGPWRFQLMLDETDGEEWVYRRDPRIRRPLAGLTVADDGFRRLAPEVQLLYKAKDPRPKDQADFEAVLPILTGEQRRWLDDALRVEHATHPWQARLRT
ncbi:nucleotidyltransferase domain-containing protein [Nonomuraea candida]|uniref:nucleotidyltransferase domain-containing protein n=1 Tax=Nonomuraea candida TaxID=359159 RepID=UPI0005BC30B7|nr:amino acid transporter [Nonomuraea candida]